jgi:hypothetical protein
MAKTMNKEFVTYEQALALKELGFDEPCLASYETAFGRDIDFELGYIIDGPKNYVLSPLKQQVFRWFREKYEWYANLSSWIHEEEIGTYHEYEIYGTPKGAYGSIKFKTYEGAENVAIDKLIEIAKQQEND